MGASNVLVTLRFLFGGKARIDEVEDEDDKAEDEDNNEDDDEDEDEDDDGCEG